MGEVYPEVVFPFSASISTLISNDPAVEALEETGVLSKRENRENADVHMRVFGGYNYVNLSVSRVLAARTPGVTVEETDATFLGSEGLAPLTDPSWTPLFVPVEAVVVDVGGQMSHAIIVSRELGLPCVVSATDATKRIPEGALIEVDGAAGTITVLEI